jgi:hypothetical protein
MLRLDVSGEVLAVVQGLATIVLVAITAYYAIETRHIARTTADLVAATEETVRLSREQQMEAAQPTSLPVGHTWRVPWLNGDGWHRSKRRLPSGPRPNAPVGWVTASPPYAGRAAPTSSTRPSASSGRWHASFRMSARCKA